MAISYDHHGIVVYNLKERKITGYASFEEMDPAPHLQGDNAISVRVSRNGKFVYAFFEGYPADGKYVHTLDEWREEKYLYDVSRDVFKQVDSYDEQFEQSVSAPEIYEGILTKRVGRTVWDGYLNMKRAAIATWQSSDWKMRRK